MLVGQVLEVLADDPAAEADMTMWTARAGHQLVDLSRLGSVYRFLRAKGPVAGGVERTRSPNGSIWTMRGSHRSTRGCSP